MIPMPDTPNPPAADDEGNSPVVLVRVPSEAQAEIIASALDAAGVPAWTTGGLISGFRAEVPAFVHVLVRKKDLAQAQEKLQQIRADANVAPDEPPSGDPT